MGWGQILGSAVGSFFGGPIGGGIGAGIGGMIDQHQANDFNSSQAAANREFQASQSGTSYQRAMADMKAAGLNPMLAFSQGGASVPVGSSASFTSAVDSSGNSASHYQSSGAAVTSADAAKKQADTQERLVDSTVSKIEQEIKTGKALEDKARGSIEVLRAEYQLLVQKKYTEVEIGNQIRSVITKLGHESYYWREHGLREEILRQLDDMDLKASQRFDTAELKAVLPFFQILRSVLRPR